MNDASTPMMLIGALLPLLMLAVSLAATVIVLIVVWRIMKAHELIAESLRRIAEKRSDTGPL